MTLQFATCTGGFSFNYTLILCIKSMSSSRLDIIIFGATGYTGKVAVEELLKLAKSKGNLSWGVAGRNKKKLEEVLKEVSEKSGKIQTQYTHLAFVIVPVMLCMGRFVQGSAIDVFPFKI